MAIGFTMYDSRIATGEPKSRRDGAAVSCFEPRELCDAMRCSTRTAS